MKQYNNITMNKGFTLIELVIAVAILAIMTLFVADFFTNLSRIYLGSISSRSGQQNIRVIMETMTRYAKQARSAEWDETKKELKLRVKDDEGNYNDITFAMETQEDYYKRTDDSGNIIKVGVIKMSMTNPSFSNQLLSSQDLNISDFSVIYSPGIPAVLNITLKAKIEEAEGKGWEKGAGGKGEIEMSTAVALKGQYY